MPKKKEYYTIPTKNIKSIGASLVPEKKEEIKEEKNRLKRLLNKLAKIKVKTNEKSLPKKMIVEENKITDDNSLPALMLVFEKEVSGKYYVIDVISGQNIGQGEASNLPIWIDEVWEDGQHGWELVYPVYYFYSESKSEIDKILQEWNNEEHLTKWTNFINEANLAFKARQDMINESVSSINPEVVAKEQKDKELKISYDYFKIPTSSIRRITNPNDSNREYVNLQGKKSGPFGIKYFKNEKNQISLKKMLPDYLVVKGLINEEIFYDLITGEEIVIGKNWSYKKWVKGNGVFIYDKSIASSVKFPRPIEFAEVLETLKLWNKPEYLEIWRNFIVDSMEVKNKMVKIEEELEEKNRQWREPILERQRQETLLKEVAISQYQEQTKEILDEIKQKQKSIGKK
jgi:hypothetical protein